MHCLLGHHLDGEGYEGDLLALEEHFDPVGAGDLERRIVADRYVAVPLLFIEEGHLRLRLGKHCFPVGSEKPDLDGEISFAADPFVHDGKAVVRGREGAREDAFEQPHEAELAAHLLPHIVADEGVV